MKQPVSSGAGARPQGPYSQAIVAGGPVVYVSGQGPIDPETGDKRLGSFREQAELTLRNVGALLEAAGTSFDHVVKVNAYLADLADFGEFNTIYREFFHEPYPARTTVQAGLSEIAIEIDCIATLPDR
ncbi:MAG: hypothetical protein GX620_00595 [Chloroflexi bacterium]|mgnify:CR=1 FL=1|nr:hypothetical protein [Chloroflexota bacterium]